MFSGDMVCLANSRKWGGRCVAGIVLPKGRWIRPVSASEHRELKDFHYALPPPHVATRVLDTVRIALEKAAPQPHHREDYLVSIAPWELVARPRTRQERMELRERLLPHLASGSELLGCRSVAVPFAEVKAREGYASLALVRPSYFDWVVAVHEHDDGDVRPKARVRMRVGEQWYVLSLTDPEWEERVMILGEGTHKSHSVGVRPGQEVWFTVSMGDPFCAREGGEACCHKLVAAVIVW